MIFSFFFVNAISEGGTSSCSLKAVNLPIMSNIECFENSNYKNISDILQTDYMMCAGFPQGGVDSCQVRKFNHKR